jgi:hypothetical protein
VERFYLFQQFWDKSVPIFILQKQNALFIPKILEQNQNFLMCSNFFLAKAKRYYLIQKMLNKTKTF